MVWWDNYSEKDEKRMKEKEKYGICKFCDEKIYARGICKKCYNRLYKVSKKLEKLNKPLNDLREKSKGLKICPRCKSKERLAFEGGVSGENQNIRWRCGECLFSWG